MKKEKKKKKSVLTSVTECVEKKIGKWNSPTPLSSLPYSLSPYHNSFY